jgi:hypothetical protein
MDIPFEELVAITRPLSPTQKARLQKESGQEAEKRK